MPTISRRSFLAGLGLGLPYALSGCAGPNQDTDHQETDAVQDEPTVDLKEFESLALKSNRWNYDEATNCYYQLGLTYCKKPATEVYEQLAIYVPAAFFEAEEHGKHYSCTPAEDAKHDEFSSAGAPIVLACNSPDFAGQEAPHTFNPQGLKEYLDAGLVYVYAGFRGRSSGFDSATDDYFSGGAPWSVVDLKAAIRYLRYNKELIPGSTKRIVLFGHGSAGALASIVGCSGNSKLFEPYLSEIGAITHDSEGNTIGDSIFGVASWCPLLAAGEVNAAYEWMMGQYAHSGLRKEGSFGERLSTDLSEAYGQYLDTLGLVDADGNRLVLDATGGGSYVAGSYYDALLDELESSLANFIKSSEFPIAISLASQASGKFPGGGESVKIEEDLEEEAAEQDKSETTLFAYETLAEYLAELNAKDQWVTYDEDTGDVRFTSLGAFSEHTRTPRGICAYDDLEKSSTMNQLYGVDEASSLHFDATLAGLLVDKAEQYKDLEGWDDSWPSAWSDDLRQADAVGNTVVTRTQMYDPFSYLAAPDEGEKPAKIAQHWRIRSGVQQANTSCTQEFALACALAAHKSVKSCDFSFVWDRAFVPAEHSGTPAASLVAWLKSCTKKKPS